MSKSTNHNGKAQVESVQESKITEAQARQLTDADLAYWLAEAKRRYPDSDTRNVLEKEYDRRNPA